MTGRKELLSEIKAISDSIRKKNQALKVGLTARNRFLEETFKPIVDPLNKLNETIKQSPTIPQEVSVKEEYGTTESSEKDTDTFSKSTDNT